ncbi:hypothetical protein CF161_11093 [Pseudomonas sp. CF161]|nr:hypothetical protein CF161_11093 [Pseudomonas sp. CF161]
MGFPYQVERSVASSARDLLGTQRRADHGMPCRYRQLRALVQATRPLALQQMPKAPIQGVWFCWTALWRRAQHDGAVGRP